MTDSFTRASENIGISISSRSLKYFSNGGNAFCKSYDYERQSVFSLSGFMIWSSWLALLLSFFNETNNSPVINGYRTQLFNLQRNIYVIFIFISDVLSCLKLLYINASSQNKTVIDEGHPRLYESRILTDDSRSARRLLFWRWSAPGERPPVRTHCHRIFVKLRPTLSFLWLVKHVEEGETSWDNQQTDLTLSSCGATYKLQVSSTIR